MPLLADGEGTGTKRRPRVCIVARYYLPGFKSGGPVRSLANVVEHLGDEICFSIVCQDRDRGDQEPYSIQGLNEWVRAGKARVRYLRSTTATPALVARAIRETRPDVIYVNGFFHPVFCAVPIWLHRLGLFSDRPILIAPRGQFAPGALSLKAVKKRTYLALYRRLGDSPRFWWHATAESERADIMREIGPSPGAIRVASNISAPARVFAVSPTVEPGRPLKIVYLSRVTPVKNLAYALRVVADSSLPLQLDVWGPIEDPSYWAECRKVIEACPRNVCVRYRGTAEPAQVAEILSRYDLLMLPTLGENHGHVIAEAFAVGLPVLISDRTPWRDLEARGVGYDLPLTDRGAFHRALSELAGAGEAERAARASRIAAYHTERCAGAVDATRQMLFELARRAPHGESR